VGHPQRVPPARFLRRQLDGFPGQLDRPARIAPCRVRAGGQQPGLSSWP
jgi:hypothetical protein